MKWMMILTAAVSATPVCAQLVTRPATGLPASPNATGAYSAVRGQWCEDSANPARQSTCDIAAHRGQALADLRMRLISATEANGGALSSLERAGFQRELDAINRRFARQVRNATVYSVDSTGRSVIR